LPGARALCWVYHDDQFQCDVVDRIRTILASRQLRHACRCEPQFRDGAAGYLLDFAGPLYSIRDRDIIVDDEGYRYGVSANYWTGIGYQLDCIRLEA
jgi:hypothetical protein